MSLENVVLILAIVGLVALIVFIIYVLMRMTFVWRIFVIVLVLSVITFFSLLPWLQSATRSLDRWTGDVSTISLSKQDNLDLSDRLLSLFNDEVPVVMYPNGEIFAEGSYYSTYSLEFMISEDDPSNLNWLREIDCSDGVLLTGASRIICDHEVKQMRLRTHQLYVFMPSVSKIDFSLTLP